MGTFDLTIVSDPSSALEPGKQVWLSDLASLTRYDENLLKPALLFADNIRLLSTRFELSNLALSEMAMARDMPMKQYINYLLLSIHRLPSDLDFLGIDESLLAPVDEARARFENRADFESPEEGDALRSFYDKYNDRMVETLKRMFYTYRDRYDQLVSEEINTAEKSGIVRICGWSEEVRDPISLALQGHQEYVETWAESAISQIAVGTDALMLEPGSALHLTTSMSSTTSMHGNHSLSPARIATSLVGMLPGLERAPMSEILEIRDGLNDYLPAFRAQVMKLSTKLAEIPDSDTRDSLALIDAEWHRSINPALAEIHAQIKRGKYRRYILEEFSTGRESLAAAAGAAVVIGGGTLVAGLVALVPGAAAAAYPFVKAMHSTIKARDDIRQNQLYFLYSSRKRLAKYARATTR